MTFGEKVKFVRTKQLYSQREFAKILGVSFVMLNQWETEKAKPNYKWQRLFKEYCEKNNFQFTD